MQGNLAEGILPELLKELYVGRKTGVLQFTRGTEARSVRFRKGHIVGGDTNVREDRLGELLVRQKILTAGDLKRATGFVLRDKKRLGAVLEQLGLLDKDRLEDALSFHVREILLKVFSWSEGAYSFEEHESEGDAFDGDVTLKISTGEMILESARRIEDPDVVRYALGDIDRILSLSTDPLLRFQAINFSPSDGYVLSRIDGTLSAREVIQLIPMVPEETQRSLFGLLCTGVVEYLPVPPKPRAATPAAGGRRVAGPAAATPVSSPAPPSPPPSPEPGPATPAARSASPPPAQVSVPAAPAPKAPSPTATPARPAPSTPSPAAPAKTPTVGKGTEERREEILDFHANMKTKNHFEFLGIPRASNEAQVKDAYFRLARRFHPDAHHDPALVDLREKLEAVFIRLGEAYEVLRNPRSRASYEADLVSRMPRSTAAATSPSAPAAPDPEREMRIAAESVWKAEKLLFEEKYWDAIQILENIVPNSPSKLKQKARVLLARAYMKNPKWLKRGEEVLQVVVKEDPDNVDAHFALGSLYQSRDLKSRAINAYRKILEVKPDHNEAQVELERLLAETPSESPGGGGGIIKKLFGKS